ncbi:hypothetical protein VSS74_05390 [Conexibacter stalactiti]|uniref:DUF4386 domain-containing protein n=1 Tax=Conexibacter stalactiti TaxID=1940611 RepID=A0ABU4HKD4_9ACTN|nr:hypothetical protein [Conexibacter stalactiti]MDW5593756.1 hypothetical protein [Conexibacter stalactiti]MEC5034398.1 hypothetical protein [Conexibacter stalactiti]
MATNDFLQAEAHGRRRVAIVSGVAAILVLASPLVGRVLIGSDIPDNAIANALLQADHRSAVLLSAVLSALGLLAITFVGDFLLRAVGNRTRIQPFVRPLLVLGGVGLAIFSVVLQIVSAIRLDHFATESTLTWEELKEAQSYGPFIFVGIVFQFAFAIGLILVALNAMRVGLLTRFLGYLGVFSAVLFVIALLPLPIVQAYWLAMLALLLWNVGGAREPPSWASGREELWPTAAEMREQRVRAAEEKRGGGSVDAVVVDDDPDGDGQNAFGQPAAAKRKRKKRR